MKRNICTQESAAGGVYHLPSACTKEFLTRYIYLEVDLLYINLVILANIIILIVKVGMFD